MEERRSDFWDPPRGGGGGQNFFSFALPRPKGSEVGGEKEEVHAREERREEGRGEETCKTKQHARQAGSKIAAINRHSEAACGWKLCRLSWRATKDKYLKIFILARAQMKKKIDFLFFSTFGFFLRQCASARFLRRTRQAPAVLHNQRKCEENNWAHHRTTLNQAPSARTGWS